MAIKSTSLTCPASYGSLARFTNIRRIRQFNSQAILGFGGDVSDMQYLDRHLQSVITDENHSDPDPITELSANNLHTYLQKVMYKRRSDMDPLWNQIIVAGLDEQKAPYLAQVDLYGTAFSAPSLATGFGAHLAQPLLRLVAKDEEAASKLSKEQAVDAIKECLKVLFYRDARSTNEYSIAVLDKDDGLDLKQTEKLENESWQFAEVIRGYGTQVA